MENNTGALTMLHDINEAALGKKSASSGELLQMNRGKIGLF
jgi:hypothetical protein